MRCDTMRCKKERALVSGSWEIRINSANCGRARVVSYLASHVSRITFSVSSIIVRTYVCIAFCNCGLLRAREWSSRITDSRYHSSYVYQLLMHNEVFLSILVGYLMVLRIPRPMRYARCQNLAAKISPQDSRFDSQNPTLSLGILFMSMR